MKTKPSFLLMAGLAALLTARTGVAQNATGTNVPAAALSISVSTNMTGTNAGTNAAADRTRTRRTGGNPTDTTRFTNTRRTGGGPGGGFGGPGAYSGAVGSTGYSGPTVQGLNDEFQIISQNNIFDTTRRRIIITPPRTNGPATYYFGLKGTMSYGGTEAFAFFNDQYTPRNSGRGFAASESINGFKVTEITNDMVKLTSPSNEVVTMKIGMQMKKTGDGPWQLMAMPDPVVRTSSSGESTESNMDVLLSGPNADVLKRLMAKRAAENGDTPDAGTEAPATTESITAPAPANGDPKP